MAAATAEVPNASQDHHRADWQVIPRHQVKESPYQFSERAIFNLHYCKTVVFSICWKYWGKTLIRQHKAFGSLIPRIRASPNTRTGCSLPMQL